MAITSDQLLWEFGTGDGNQPLNLGIAATAVTTLLQTVGQRHVSAAEASLEKAELAVEFDEKKAGLAEVKAAVVNAGFKTE